MNKRMALQRNLILAAVLIQCATINALAVEIDSVTVDRVDEKIIVKGSDLSSVTEFLLGGVSVPIGNATAAQLEIPFGPEVAEAAQWRGSYKLLANGTVGFSLYIDAPIDDPAPPPPPPGSDCPCSTEWDEKSTTPSPGGFAGLTPYCSEDSASWVTVQFYDVPASNYWVLWTEWQAANNSGYCELWGDGPYRTLDTEAQFDACAGYLRNIVSVRGNQGNYCLY